MKHVSTLTSATLKQTAAHGGCGECQTSCQSACKTSCTVANQKCWAKFYCSGGCSAANYNMNHDMNDSYDLGCEMERKRLECAIYLKAMDKICTEEAK